MEFIKKNFALLLAFTLPVALIIIVAVSVYLSSLSVPTNYNFVYLSCTNSSWVCNNLLPQLYSVVDNKIVRNNIDPTLDSDTNKIPDAMEADAISIFLHDTKKNESREITFGEAQSFTLSSLLTSPEGTIVSNYYNRGGSPSFIVDDGYSSSDYYLSTGRRGGTKLNLLNNAGYYENNIQFIGWVLPGRD